ncbi:unnamed protein product [Dovyalis caffra]|uniref:Eukaryotic translation initiation factor 4E-1 n=1 Tax=Dovyalis caffra TaxID=77055 RepID=A0AAV1QPA6_9ROSI|nr:unnamed protein product [Dovyalis caffra]
MYHPSKLAVGADFYCFKHKIEPNWEDPVCVNGGKWIVCFPEGKSGKSDTSWLKTLLAMIGGQLDHGDEICGAAVSVRRKQERIALWTKNASNEAAQLSIGKQWKEFLNYNGPIGFIFHDDAKKLKRSAKKRYKMHDLLQEMGYSIVSEESENPRKRSRLVDPEDIYHVLKKRKGTKAVKGIYLDMSESMEMQLKSDAFTGMRCLEFLIIKGNLSKVQLPYRGLEFQYAGIFPLG